MSSRIFGYGRVSSKDQNEARQLKAFKDYGTYMSKYTKAVEAFEKWEDDDLNSKEEAYYIKVQTRVSKKLLEIQ